MTSGVPWQVKGVRREVIRTAREAARRSGMSVAEWLDTVIVESANDVGVDSSDRVFSDFDDDEPRRKRRKYAEYDERHRAGPAPELTEVAARLDTLSRQIVDLAQTSAEAATQAAEAVQAARREPPAGANDDTPRMIADALSRLDRRLDQLIEDGHAASTEMEQRVSAIDRAVSRLDRGTPNPSSEAPLDQAMAEIEARQRALDGEAPAPRTEFARAPTQQMPDLERELREINARIETMRTCGLDSAVETLRDDLAEIGMMLKDATPKRAIKSLETEVRSLASRIDDQRHAGADGAAIAGIERGLSEVRDALHGLTPAESLAGYGEAVQSLAQKIDRLAGAGQDPASIEQLEGAVVALRGVVSHVASDDALAKLSDEVRLLSAKIDHVASSDAFSTIERQISSITDALQSRHQASREAPDLEAVMASLAEKFERLQLSSTDHTAVAHLEDRIVSLVEKLDASDTRLSQLEAVERGLTDLLVHFENQKVQARAEPAFFAETDTLKHDVLRTQDSLEAVHGTLGHVVDRLATIETTIRSTQLPRASNIPEPVPEPVTPTAAAPPPSAPLAVPAIPVAAVLPATAPASDFEPRAEQPVLSPNPPPMASASSNPAPAHDHRPIDPNLPPDHPLEPGAVRSRSSPAERIAASEAALGSARPPVIPDPGGKSNFIAAARRAAQAAIVEAPPPKDKPALASSSPTRASIADRLGGKVRKLLVGAGVVLLLLGSMHYAATRLWRADPGGSTAQAIPEDSSPSTTRGDASAPAPAPAPAPPPPTAAPGRQSAVLPFGDGNPPATIPGTNIAFGPLPTLEPDSEATGSVRAPAAQIATVAPAQAPALQPAAARDAGGDRLPPGIGSSGLRAAAVKGDAPAEFEIASRYAEGRGVPQNLAQAAAWFERAADKGLVPAHFRLGGLYEKGLGVAKNIDTARRHYLAAAEAGNGKAMHNLAVLYSEGIDGRPDYQTAARWFRKAADRGIVDSQYNLAVLYARGIGVEANLVEAFKWFALASRDGDREATRKRDEVAGRLDRASLAAAMQAAQSWQAQPQPEAAVQVRVPAGGWDGAPAPSAARRSVGPKREAPPRRPLP